MNREELAQALSEADPATRASLLARYPDLADGDLAERLRARYFDHYSGDLGRAVGAAQALVDLAALLSDPHISAVAQWVAGLVALQIEGRAEQAIERIDAAEASFLALGQEYSAATTQVSKIMALARLGRYDEAISIGTRARATLLAHGDSLAAGRVELNLGNLADRRGQYSQAVKYYEAARERFSQAGDQRMLAYVQNGLANVLSQQFQFEAAAALYEQALVVAEVANLEVTRAEIECNLGVMALSQGHYDRALALLEQSRRRYAALAMPHESAIAELELADAYMELSLATEAAALYSVAIDAFTELGMRSEQARALLNHGRACLQLGATDAAWALFDEASELYAAEQNVTASAVVALAEAQLYYAEGEYAHVTAVVSRAEAALSRARFWDQLALLYWLDGEAKRLLDDPDAEAQLNRALGDAEQYGVSRIAQRCQISLGYLALQAGDHAAAEARFLAAAELGEIMRVPLPADELRMAVAAETVGPFRELIRLCLDGPQGARVAAAFGYAERSRARAMIEMLGSSAQLPQIGHDAGNSAYLERLNELRAELNWIYNRLSHLASDDVNETTSLAGLYQAAREREAAVSELRRRMRHTSSGAVATGRSLDLAGLQAALGADTALIEYVELSDELLAFVVTNAEIAVVRHLGPMSAIEVALSRFRFQIGTLGHGASAVRAHMRTLTARTRAHLGELYELLIRPLEPLIGDRRLAVVPCGPLHYVPFHALYDGSAYLLAQREVCCVPSAEMLQHCLAQPSTPLRQALLVGLADDSAPRACDEVAALAPGFARAVTLLDEAATSTALAAAAQTADVLHLACHGRFRADSPLFSALRLANGWLTVHDIYGLDLHCQLVTLSACETGLHDVAPGDELVGLARGFFLAGAPTLVVSQWRIDDEATVDLMAAFYQQLLAGAKPAAALRSAQLAMQERWPHPFFWASFSVLGRW